MYTNTETFLKSSTANFFDVSNLKEESWQAATTTHSGGQLIFETNKNKITSGGAGVHVAKDSHSFYSDFFGGSVFSDNSFIWGRTTIGFKGGLTVIEKSKVKISFVLDGQFVVMDDQFGFEANTKNRLLEWLRAEGAKIIGPGTPFDLRFTGPGVNVSGLFTIVVNPRTGVLYMTQQSSHCFTAQTCIQKSLTTTTTISDLHVGDVILAFDAEADLGRGALVPRRVTRLYLNSTLEWIKLVWIDAGEQKELITTPGHHFLDQYGQFPTIAEMTRNGTTTVVLASGELAEVTAERIVYSTETAHLFERATVQGMVSGNPALQPVEMDAWQTYNIEVEDLHTYVAGGVRVHNESGLLGRIGNLFSEGGDRFVSDGLIDTVGDGINNLLHSVGEGLDRVWNAVTGMNDPVMKAFWDHPLDHLNSAEQSSFQKGWEERGQYVPEGYKLVPNGGGFFYCWCRDKGFVWQHSLYTGRSASKFQCQQH